MDILRLPSTDSTNSWVAAHEHELTSPSLVYSAAQTAGRGQRGNSWESQPEKNITASLIFHPLNFPAIRQFLISEIIALAIIDFLKDYDVEALIKWPNDIYVGDKKICGILVEHVVTGKNITRTIAGMGININQTEFMSDAPNPTSLSILKGKSYDIKSLINNLAFHLQQGLSLVAEEENIHKRFLDFLWRKDDHSYSFFDKKENRKIEAAIKNVSPTGEISLITKEGDTRCFFFKEVEFIL